MADAPEQKPLEGERPLVLSEMLKDQLIIALLVRLGGKAKFTLPMLTGGPDKYVAVVAQEVGGQLTIKLRKRV